MESDVNTDIIARKAALEGVYAAMEMHVTRSEALALEGKRLADEIDELEARLIR